LAGTRERTTPEALAALIEARSRASAPPAARVLADELVARAGGAAQAVLFYGSCYRADDPDGLLDLYLLVDGYRRFYGRRLPAVANRVLPPNVYYVEASLGRRRMRAKYAVLSLAQFERGVSRWFHSYLWARFAQPCALLYARDETAHERVRACLARAVLRFQSRALARAPAELTARDLWQTGLALSYAAEFRAERPEHVRALYEADADFYERATEAAIPVLPYPVEVRGEGAPRRYAAHVPAAARARSRVEWALRRAQGKVLSLLRLVKAAFTFDGGIDYVSWKVERHSGVRLEVTPAMRRHPVLAGLPAILRAYRRRGFR